MSASSRSDAPSSQRALRTSSVRGQRQNGKTSGSSSGVIEQRPQRAVDVGAEVLVAELEQRDPRRDRGHPVERLHPAPEPRRVRPRCGAADPRAAPRRRSSPPRSSRPDARRARYGRTERAERLAQDLEVAAEGGPLREHPLATMALAELGQAFADGRGGGGSVGEQVVPDLPLLARPRPQPAAPRWIPLVPGVRHESKPWLEEAGAGPALASWIVPSRSVNCENQTRLGW